MYDVLVIGGGASGLAAGISAARAGAGCVAVVERQARVGKKLLATGNGRCNLYHYGLRAEEYAGDRAFIRAVLGGFDADAFFDSLGLPVAVEENGCAYPGSNQASAVLDCLRRALKRSAGLTFRGWRAAGRAGAHGRRTGVRFRRRA